MSLTERSSQQCQVEIADVPAQYKTLHNMVFVHSDTDPALIVCNGLNERSEAECHQWSVGNSSWQIHSYPNKPTSLQQALCRINTDDWLKDREECDLNGKGRYAGQMVHLAVGRQRNVAYNILSQ